jgi:hypothetical protein
MKIGVRIRIDVTKIDKEILFKGEKGVYLNASTFIDLDNQNQYGDNGFISQDVSREAREAGEKGAILGNVKVFYNDGVVGSDGSSNGRAAQQPPTAHHDDIGDDVPF